MKKFLVFTIVIISFFLIPKDVSATLFTLDDFKDILIGYNEQINPNAEYELEIIVKVVDNTMNLSMVISGDDDFHEFNSFGILNGRYLEFESKINDDSFEENLLNAIILDAYGQLHGFEPFHFYLYFSTLLEDVLKDMDYEEMESFTQFHYEGIELNYIDEHTVFFRLDLGVKPKEPENKEVIEDKDIKEEIIDVNPPTGLNTHYLSLSILGITTIFSLFKLNKKKYLV